jgi:pilus biogenesis lipoprotein CpaD
MNMTRTGVFALASLLLLGACDLKLNEHVMKARENNDLRQANRVDLVQYKHAIKFNGGRNLPSDAEYDRFDDFMKSIQLGYADEVVLRGSTAYRRDAMAAYIQRLGIPAEIQTEPGSKEERTANTVAVTVNRYVVTPPACPNWSNLDGNDNRNTPGSNYGCSVDASLGYMIANPRDLVQGRVAGPAPSAPLIGAEQRYDAGKVKTPASTGTGG